VTKAPTFVEGLSSGSAHHNPRRHADVVAGSSSLANGRNRRRARFDAFLAASSAALAGIAGPDMGKVVCVWLRKLAHLVRVDCISQWEWQLDEPVVRARFAYSTCGPHAPEPPVSTRAYPWLAQQYRNGKVVAWSRIPDDIPPEAIAERVRAVEVGAKSALEIPMHFGKRVYVIAFMSRQHYRPWSRRTIGRLRLAGEVFLEAILRQQAEHFPFAETLSQARRIVRRRRLARRLRESERKFGVTFEHCALGMALVSLEGHWVKVNPALVRILGYTKSELQARDFQTLTHPEDLPRDMADLRRTVAGEIDYYEMEKRYIHKEGRLVEASLTASLVRARDGEPLYFVSQVMDLTDRKATQLELARLRSQLAHMGRVRVTSQLSTSLTHQLVQPVTAIIGNVAAGQHILRSERPDLASLQGILQDINACGGGVARIIERIRRHLRNELIPSEHLNFDQIVSEMIEMIHSHLVLHQVRLRLRLDSAAERVMGDRIQLEQVVLNLLMNAIESMADSPTAERVLLVSTRDSGDEIELSVCDHGVGIDAAYLQRMFDPFFTTKPTGMGMGLTLAATVVAAHGGKIWAKRNDGPGLTLYCRLPISIHSA
jgi:PAS domain S-box-containing protein